MTYSLDTLVNDFAIRSFRDTADQDYIAARQSFRARLIPQFHWSALQALEKYLKCILILNRIRAPKSHDLGELLKAMNDGGLEIGLSRVSYDFFVHLDQCARYRYFEVSWAVEGPELIYLDHAAWDLRRYAQASAVGQVHSTKDMVASIKAKSDAEGNRFQIAGGVLEAILATPDHPARPYLIWQNGWYSRSNRKKIRYWPGLHGANAPLEIHPEILQEVLKYIWLPGKLQQEYKYRS
jgi:hypothetical protein